MVNTYGGIEEGIEFEDESGCGYVVHDNPGEESLIYVKEMGSGEIVEREIDEVKRLITFSKS